MKLADADKENTFLRSEVKHLTVLLNVKIQSSSHNSKPYRKECFLREKFDTQVQSLSSSDLATPATSDLDTDLILKSPNFSNDNSKTLKLFN